MLLALEILQYHILITGQYIDSLVQNCDVCSVLSAMEILQYCTLISSVRKEYIR